jgi:hypothetical protein
MEGAPENYLPLELLPVPWVVHAIHYRYWIMADMPDTAWVASLMPFGLPHQTIYGYGPSPRSAFLNALAMVPRAA